jgi:hypothetical protein
MKISAMYGGWMWLAAHERHHLAVELLLDHRLEVRLHRGLDLAAQGLDGIAPPRLREAALGPCEVVLQHADHHVAADDGARPRGAASDALLEDRDHPGGDS